MTPALSPAERTPEPTLRRLRVKIEDYPGPTMGDGRRDRPQPLQCRDVGDRRAPRLPQPAHADCGRAHGSRLRRLPIHFAAAQGFAFGGRPRGLDPRDTVPIWVQPGEFVLRKSAVDQYGARTIEALNRGMVDPTALGGAAVASLPPVHGRGFAAGGRISEALAAASSRVESAPAVAVLPVLAVTEDVADTILREGDGAFRRALSRNRSTIASMSPQQQRGRG